MGSDGAATAPTAGAVASVIQEQEQEQRRPRAAIRWTTAMRHAFFAHLAGSCNVTAAAAAIGVPASQVYYHRKTNPAFATDWQQAIGIAYEVLEARMLGHVMAGGVGAIPAAGPLAPEPIAWDAAVKLLTLHKARRDGRSRVRGPSQLVATRAETDAAIFRKLANLAVRKQREAEAAARRGLPAPPVPVPVPEPGSGSGSEPAGCDGHESHERDERHERDSGGGSGTRAGGRQEGRGA